MNLEKINIGNSPDDGAGSTLREGGSIINSNFEIIENNLTSIAEALGRINDISSDGDIENIQNANGDDVLFLKEINPSLIGDRIIPVIVSLDAKGRVIDLRSITSVSPLVSLELSDLLPVNSATLGGRSLTIDSLKEFLKSHLQPLHKNLTNFSTVVGETNKIPYFVNDNAISLLSLDTDPNLTANSQTAVSSQAAVKAYVENIITNLDFNSFKGVIDASANPDYPTAEKGHLYRISVAGKIGGSSGDNVEVGDIILCLENNTPSGTRQAVGARWAILQGNIDGAVIGPSSVSDNQIAIFDGNSGRLIKAFTIHQLLDLLGNNIPTGSLIAKNSDQWVYIQPGLVDTVLTSNGQSSLPSFKEINTGNNDTPLVKPPQDGWIWVNQQNASITSGADKQTIQVANSSSTLNVIARVRPITSDQYEATFILDTLHPNRASLSAGIVLFNNISNRLIRFMHGSGGLLFADKLTSVNAIDSSYKSFSLDKARFIALRISNEGNFRRFFYSNNGVEWLNFLNVVKTDFITPTHIGFGVTSHDQAGNEPILNSLISYKFTDKGGSIPNVDPFANNTLLYMTFSNSEPKLFINEADPNTVFTVLASPSNADSQVINDQQSALFTRTAGYDALRSGINTTLGTFNIESKRSFTYEFEFTLNLRPAGYNFTRGLPPVVYIYSQYGDLGTITPQFALFLDVQIGPPVRFFPRIYFSNSGANNNVQQVTGGEVFANQKTNIAVVARPNGLANGFSTIDLWLNGVKTATIEQNAVYGRNNASPRIEIGNGGVNSPNNDIATHWNFLGRMHYVRIADAVRFLNNYTPGKNVYSS